MRECSDMTFVELVLGRISWIEALILDLRRRVVDLIARASCGVQSLLADLASLRDGFGC